MRRKVLLSLILIAPLGIFFPFLGDFPYAPGSAYSDLAISHYPNAIYLLQSLRQWHQIPMWAGSILSGYPFAADPLSGLWYPPGWLAYIFPLPLGFNINILLHLFLGGAGTFLFLRKEGRSDFAALAGGLIFELFPKITAHYAAGHLTILYAIAWTPWLFLCEKHLKGVMRLVCSSAVLGLVALADLRIFAFLFFAWAAFALYGWWQRRDASLGKFAGRALLSTGLGLLISAPLFLPLVEYTGLTSRATLAAADNQALALPVNYLAGLVIPNVRSYVEWIIYPGGAALVILLFALTVPELRKRNWFWLGMVLVSLLLAVGPATPVGDWLFRLPGFNLLRIPSRVIFLAGWALAIVAADGIDFLMQLSPGKKQPGSGLPIAAVSGFVTLICLGLWIFTGSIPIPFAWGMAAVLVPTLLLLARRGGRLPPRMYFLLALPLICLDLGGVDRLNVDFQVTADVLNEGKGAISLIQQKESGEKFRVYSPSYSLPQQTATQAGIELADGIDPMQLTSYLSFMEDATGVPNQGYSVTLPPFSSANPALDNLGYQPDSFLLGVLNVKYVVSAFDIAADQLKLIGTVDGTRVYENEDFRPRAWVQMSPDEQASGFTSVDGMAWSPNRIRVSTSQAGRLVLSEIDYPGWKAWIDGQPATIKPAWDILRSVEVPAGLHTVTFEFQPITVYVGLALGVDGWLITLALLVIFRGRK